MKLQRFHIRIISDVTDEGTVKKMSVTCWVGCFVPPNFLSELWFVELACRACVTDACNPKINSSAVIQRQYRTFDVIKSIAIECVRSQQDVRGIKYHPRRRNGFTEQ